MFSVWIPPIDRPDSARVSAVPVVRYVRLDERDDVLQQLVVEGILVASAVIT